jgi:hypothetical protein
LTASANGPAAITVGVSGWLAKLAITRGSKPFRSRVGNASGSPNWSLAPASPGCGALTKRAAARTASAADSFTERGTSPGTVTVVPVVSARSPSGRNRTICAAWKMSIDL